MCISETTHQAFSKIGSLTFEFLNHGVTLIHNQSFLYDISNHVLT